MSKIMKTKDYSIFKKMLGNREIIPGNLKNIINSIQSKNMLEFRPIIVDKDMNVIDGQHRLRAAEDLDIEIYYQIDSSSSADDIIRYNASQMGWKMSNYINFYAERGHSEYILFRDFCEKYKVDYGFLRNYMKGERDSVLATMKQGNLKFFSEEQLKEIKEKIRKIEEVGEVLRRYIPIGINDFLKSPKLKAAISLLLDNPNLNFDLLLRRAAMRIDMVRACPSVPTYYAMLVTIYNYRNQDPL
jgi:hypothetical protein